MSNTINTSNAFPPIAPTSNRAPAGVDSPSSSGFGAALKDAVSKVEDLHSDAATQVNELLRGNRDDLQNVMISVEKADIAFQLMMQMRNKIVNAYQEVSRMQF